MSGLTQAHAGALELMAETIASDAGASHETGALVGALVKDASELLFAAVEGGPSRAELERQALLKIERRISDELARREASE